MSIRVFFVLIALVCASLSVYFLAMNTVFDDKQAEAPQLVSSITYLDILENDEFKMGMQDAVMRRDQALAESLQQRALEIAYAVPLPDADIRRLSGQEGLRFMQFLAKRQLFVAGVERRYAALKGIDDLKVLFPEAQDLFHESEQMIEQRDALIIQMAEALANGQNTDDFLDDAKQQWLALNRQSSANRR